MKWQEAWMRGVWRQIAGVAMTSALVAMPAAAQAPVQAPPASAARAAGEEPPRLGVFDMDRIMAKSAAGVAAREVIERERAMMQKDVDTKRQELEKLKEELDKKGPLMTAEARREKEDSFERKRRDYARLRDDYTKELEKKAGELQRRVLREVHGVIQQVATKGRYLLIIERQFVAYMAPSADVTEDIIRAYDQQTPPKKP
jgi:outer membrane protein